MYILQGRLNNDDEDDNVKKNWFYEQNNTASTYRAFSLFLRLPLKDEFSFPFLNLVKSLRIQLQEKSHTFDKLSESQKVCSSFHRSTEIGQIFPL